MTATGHWPLLLTAYNVQSAECDVGEQVERFAAYLNAQLAGQDGALLVEHIDEVVQDFEMESGRENLQREGVVSTQRLNCTS